MGDEPAKFRAACIAISSEMHTLLTLPSLSSAIFTTAAEGEEAPRDVALDVNAARCATVTPCCVLRSAVVPFGMALEATSSTNGPSFIDRDW